MRLKLCGVVDPLLSNKSSEVLRPRSEGCLRGACTGGRGLGGGALPAATTGRWLEILRSCSLDVRLRDLALPEELDCGRLWD